MSDGGGINDANIGVRGLKVKLKLGLPWRGSFPRAVSSFRPRRRLRSPCRAARLAIAPHQRQSYAIRMITSASFRDGPQGRARNPEIRSEFASGFRVRAFSAPRNDHPESIIRIPYHHISGKAGSVVHLSIPIHGNRPLKVGLLRHLAKLAEISDEEVK